MVQNLAQRLENRQELMFESDLEYTLALKKVIGLVLKMVTVLVLKMAMELVM
jgi:hypothetical protein